MTVTQGIYEIGGPNENSPLCITTNFSLTYFIVSGEIEGSRVPTWLLVMDTEGLSVMTAWAAGKFSEMQWPPCEKERHCRQNCPQKIIIPGYAPRSAEIWKRSCQVGSDHRPRDASLIPKFLKEG